MLESRVGIMWESRARINRKTRSEVRISLECLSLECLSLECLWLLTWMRELFQMRRVLAAAVLFTHLSLDLLLFLVAQLHLLFFLALRVLLLAFAAGRLSAGRRSLCWLRFAWRFPGRRSFHLPVRAALIVVVRTGRPSTTRAFGFAWNSKEFSVSGCLVSAS